MEEEDEVIGEPRGIVDTGRGGSRKRWCWEGEMAKSGLRPAGFRPAGAI